MVKIKEIFVRNDFTEIISEKFARRYHINLSHYTAPFGYFNEADGTILCDSRLPDGTYILIGSVTYPGSSMYSKHTVFQFNVLKAAGKDLRFAQRLSGYPDKPSAIQLTPTFPLFRIGERTDYKEICRHYFESIRRYYSIDELVTKIHSLTHMSLEDKVYRFRLALQRELDKDRLI